MLLEDGAGADQPRNQEPYTAGLYTTVGERNISLDYMARLHLFDLDGTLIYGSAAAIEISRQLGLENDIASLERSFALGALSPAQFALEAAQLWQDLTQAQVAAAFDGAPWLSGIREVWAEIRSRGDRCAVISLSPDFFVERLQDWGVDVARGSRWPKLPFREPLDPTGILDPTAKIRIAEELCATLGVERTQCIAYGDSLSDAPLFAAVPVSVAINADHHVRDLASHSYHGQDLRAAFALVADHR